MPRSPQETEALLRDAAHRLRKAAEDAEAQAKKYEELKRQINTHVVQIEAENSRLGERLATLEAAIREMVRLAPDNPEIENLARGMMVHHQFDS